MPRLPEFVRCPGCEKHPAKRHCPSGSCLWFYCDREDGGCGHTVEGTWVKSGLKMKLVVKRGFPA